MPNTDHVFVPVLSVVACGSIVALIVAIAACGLRRWKFAARVSRAVALAGPVLFLVSAIAFMVLPARAGGWDDRATKATVLSEGVSELMNTGGLALAAALPGALVWGLARWRLRVGTRPNAG